MKFIINVLPDNHFTKENLKQFCLNIRNQNAANVTLVLKKVPSLTVRLIRLAKSIYPHLIVINKYRELTWQSSKLCYWLNLKVTDCLLPNALMQWEQIIQRHTSNVIRLTYLDNSISLSKQIDDIFENLAEEHPTHVDTVKRVMKLPINIPLFNLSLSQKLMILLGLQSYEIEDTLDRYHDLNDSQLGFNFLIRCNTKFITNLESGLISAVIRAVLFEPEIITVNLPTIILSKLSLSKRINWLLQVVRAHQYIGDAHVLDDYQKFSNNEIDLVKKVVIHSSRSFLMKKRLISKINRIIKATENN